MGQVDNPRSKKADEKFTAEQARFGYEWHSHITAASMSREQAAESSLQPGGRKLLTDD